MFHELKFYLLFDVALVVGRVVVVGVDASIILLNDIVVQ